MEAVKSRDGTPIAYERAGSGPPLVLVHGSTSDHDTAYRYVIPMLERYFTVRALDRRGVVGTFMTDIITMSTDDLSVLRSQPRWLERLKNAHTIPRELHADRDYRFDPARFATFEVPTLIVVGERSPESDHVDAEALAAALPNSRIEVLPGQGHAAMHTSPELFVAAVGDFFLY